MKTTLRTIAVLVALVMATPAMVSAQSFSGVVAGVVKDDQGGVLPGAAVHPVLRPLRQGWQGDV